jgi:hypothetical protein
MAGKFKISYFTPEEEEKNHEKRLGGKEKHVHLHNSLL